MINLEAETSDTSCSKKKNDNLKQNTFTKCQMTVDLKTVLP